MRLPRPLTAMLSLVAGVALCLGPAPVASADPTDPEQQKLAQEGGSPPAKDTGYASSLAEEELLRSAALPESISPGVSVQGGTVVNRVFADASAPSPGAQPSRFTAASLAALQQELTQLAGQEGVFFGFGYRADSDSIEVTGNIPRSRLPQAALESGAITYQQVSTGGRQDRVNDTEPHWGGAAITSNLHARCSSGFMVQDANMNRFALTAAHCGYHGTVWSSGMFSYGTMVRRGRFPSYDMALIGWERYGTYTWMGGTAGPPMKTGPAANPAVGISYCTSGATSNENCDKKVIGLHDSLCDSSGCTYGLVAYTGGAPTRGGDSGGALVLKSGDRVHPRGIHIGASGSTMYEIGRAHV